jgi:tetratricopeptide (TPR) repeat protein
MFKLHRYQWRTVAGLALIVVAVASGCCPPYCPPTPIVPPTDDWNNLLDAGDYDTLIEQTSAASDNRADAYHAEANLYNGLALIGHGEDPKAALERLDTAERFSDELTSVDATLELTLLYRGKMIALARLGELEAAREYLALAIETSPDLEKEIQQEFEDAVR